MPGQLVNPLPARAFYRSAAERPIRANWEGPEPQCSSAVPLLPPAGGKYPLKIWGFYRLTSLLQAFSV